MAKVKLFEKKSYIYICPRFTFTFTINITLVSGLMSCDVVQYKKNCCG